MQAGSRRKGTALANSDLDLFVVTIRNEHRSTVTQAERVRVADMCKEKLHNKGFRYVAFPGKVVINLRLQGPAAGELPNEIDIAFDKFKHWERQPPEPAICGNPGACKAVKLLKLMKLGYRLPAVPGYRLEEYVLAAVGGRHGVAQAIAAVINGLADHDPAPQERLASNAWQERAGYVRKIMVGSGKWDKMGVQLKA